MKRVPKIALVGRPNVGKSALFNRVCQKRISIVDEAEGVTRDRIYGRFDLFGQEFEVIDTGGIDPKSGLPFNEEVIAQTEIAIEEADGLILVVDGRVGVTSLDEEVAKRLLRQNKPLVLAVNKIDSAIEEGEEFPFYSLGVEDVVFVSAIQGNAIAEMLELVTKELTCDEEEGAEAGVKVALVGRPNVGKSTLINHLLGEKRCCVSPIAGTTRDSVDVLVEEGGENFTLIDTAGIRKKQKEKDVVDKFAAIRTERAIDRADVCLLMVDAQEGITAREKRIATLIEEKGKACVLLLNKWDLVKGYRMEHCLRGIKEAIPFLRHCPVVFLSAETGRNVDKIFPLIREVWAEANKRISTGQLNKFIETAMQRVHPPMIKGKRLRVYYLTQIGNCPPHFVLFINYPDLMTESYRKYLVGRLRREFQFSGSPIVFRLKGRGTRQVREKSLCSSATGGSHL